MNEILKEYEIFLKQFPAATQYGYMIYARGFLEYLEKKGIDFNEANDKAVEEYAGESRYKRTGARRFLSFIRDEEFIPLVMKKKINKELPEALSIHLDKYIRYVRLRGVSERTVKIFHSSIRRFLEYLAENQIGDITRVTKKVISDYSLCLLVYRFKRKEKEEEKPYNAVSRLNILVRLRSFFDYLRKEGIVPNNPAESAPLPKTPRTLSREIPAVKEIDRILEVIDKRKIAGLRNYAIIEMLYSTGLRVMELVRLNTEDVDFERKFITVRKGKYGKPRTVPASWVCLSAISDYLEKSRLEMVFKKKENEKAGETPLFLSSKDGERLTNHAVIGIIKNCAGKAGIKKHLIAHSFRYACATHMMRNGADIRFIQEMLGHESLRTTEGYTRVVKGDLKRIIRLFHPREADYQDGIQSQKILSQEARPGSENAR